MKGLVILIVAGLAVGAWYSANKSETDKRRAELKDIIKDNNNVPLLQALDQMLEHEIDDIYTMYQYLLQDKIIPAASQLNQRLDALAVKYGFSWS